MQVVDDLKAHVAGLISSGVPPLEVVVVEVHPDYPGELVFQVFEGQAAFCSRYRDWLSAYSVLSEIFNLPSFVKVLEDEGWTVVFGPDTKAVWEDFVNWSKPLEIEGYDLHTFQQFSLRRGREQRFWFFNWATGAGKSFTCAAGAKWLIDEGDVELVIACTLPKSKIDMLRFFEHAGLNAMINDGTKAKRRKGYTNPDVNVYVMNYEKLRVDFNELVQLCRARRVLFIFDECHKLVTAEKQNKARQCFENLATTCADRWIWPMSASVVDGNPLRFRDVFGLGQGSKNPLGGKTAFERRYANEIKVIDIKTPNGKTFPLITYDWNLTRLQDVRHRVGDLTQTARKTDPGIAPLFKGLQTIRESVQFSPEELEISERIIDVAWQAYQRKENLGPYYSTLRMVANTPQALLHTDHDFAREIAKDIEDYLHNNPGSSKIEKVNEKLASIRESGDKVLVFTHWTNLSLHLISDLIEVPCVLHYGVGQSDKASQAAKDQFATDPDITCFLTSDAGSHGLNMQMAKYVLQLEPTYSYDLAMQRASRIDRADSHLDGLTNYQMITEGSVEERVWEIQNARRIISSVVQGTNEVHSYSPQDLDRAKQPEMNNMAWLMFGDRL
jgi:superfamily II DNA or RNA helicase